MLAALFTRFFSRLSEQSPSTNETSHGDLFGRVADEEDGDSDSSKDEHYHYIPSAEDMTSLYVPHGRWEWAKNLPIVNPTVVQELGCSREFIYLQS